MRNNAQLTGLPESKIVNIGDFKMGIIHGHQVVPWGDQESLASVARSMGVDILISGHTHKNKISTYDGKYFINPGSATGAYSSISPEANPSFILMAFSADEILVFVYEFEGGQVKVAKTEISK